MDIIQNRLKPEPNVYQNSKPEPKNFGTDQALVPVTVTCTCFHESFQVNFSFFNDENLRENKEVFFLRQFDEYFFFFFEEW